MVQKVSLLSGFFTLCRNYNKDFVQYIIQDFKKPLGVAKIHYAG